MKEIGTSVVDTKEYIELLEFKKTMDRDFVEFEYSLDIWKYAYSKDDFLKSHKKHLDNLKQINKDLTIEISTLKMEISELKIKELKFESNNNISKFGWYSFIRGAIFGLGIAVLTSIIYSAIKY